MLITLYLVNQKILSRPTLYLSEFIEKNRILYYDNLSAVTEKSNMEQWLKFFLVGVIETAKTAIDTFNKIISLRDKLQDKIIISMGKRVPKAKLLLEYLYTKPVITVSDVETIIDVSKQTANSLIKDLQHLGILKEQTGFRRNRVFVFDQYLKLFQR